MQTPEFQDQFLDSLSNDELRELVYCWDFWARPNQLRPAGKWRYWYLQAGRGFGKTRTLVQTVLDFIEEGYEYVNLAARTSGDLRKILIDGESGLRKCAPPDLRPKFKISLKELHWPDGRKSLCFSADEPDQARGPQSEKLVCDEIATWPDPEFFDNLDKGLRIGDNPQMVAASTGKRKNAVINAILAKNPVITRGSTFDNAGNLDASYVEQMARDYDGSVRGRQELYGDTCDELSGALFSQDNIDRNRVGEAPPLERVVVGCDPSISSSRRADAKGIVFAGRGLDGKIYVLEDVSVQAPPQVWIPRLLEGCRKWGCKRVIVETNRGGELLDHSIYRYAEDVGLNIEVCCINTQEDKTSRAEPVSISYEKNRVCHVGTHAELEKEMVDWEPEQTTWSPNRLDALAFAVNDLLPLCTSSFDSFRIYPKTPEQSPLGRPTQQLLARADQLLEGRERRGIWR